MQGENSQANAEVQEIVTEEVNTPQEEPEVQVTVSEEENTPQEPQTEKPLTAEEYRKIAREEAAREAQSQIAKSETRTNKRIQERIAGVQANKQILNLSEEQVQQAEDKIIEEERRNSYRPNEQQVSGSLGVAPEADPIRMLNGLIGAVFQTVGTAVTNNDAESKELQAAIDKAWTVDGPEGLAMVQIAAADAARKKAARLEAQKKNAAARVVGGGENNTSDPNNISNITDAKELYRLGEKKLGGR